jgi:endonuclease/exonuclease/phosphatase family metal-dependent hydrolase
VSWNPNSFSLLPFLSCGGIMLKGRVLSSQCPITFLNVYGSCIEKRTFWDKLVDSGILEAGNLVLAGDLNITLSAEEMWGSTNYSVSLADHLNALFQSKHLVDICPERMVPTWRNGRQGSQAIAKRLDRVFISERN